MSRSPPMHILPSAAKTSCAATFYRKKRLYRLMRRDFAAIALFLVLALGFSVCYWGMMRIWPEGSLPRVLELFLWGLFRGFGPAVAALIAAYYKDRAIGIKRIFSSL